MSVIQQLLLLPIRAYRRFLSPLKPPCCRYHPTCSLYALEAIETHGIMGGSWLAVRRLLRCHPFAGYGEDPVPDRKV
jgi:uncharacterized protein